MRMNTDNAVCFQTFVLICLAGFCAGCFTGCAGNRPKGIYSEAARQIRADARRGDTPPPPRPNHLALARDLIARRLHDVALVQLALVPPDQAGTPQVYYLKGVCHREAQQPDKAAVAFKQALARDAGYAPAHNGLGLLFERQGQRPAAIAAFQKAVDLDPARADFRNNLGFALLQDGRLRAAERQLRRSLMLDPALQIARNNLAVCHGYQGRDDAALRVLLRDTSAPLAYRNMAALYRLMGRPEKAAAMVQKANTARADIRTERKEE